MWPARWQALPRSAGRVSSPARWKRPRNCRITQSLQHAGARAGGRVAHARVSQAAQNGPPSQARACRACERVHACPAQCA
eukprot:5157019-Pyramimonas_sp.AAC.1